MSIAPNDMFRVYASLTCVGEEPATGLIMIGVRHKQRISGVMAAETTTTISSLFEAYSSTFKLDLSVVDSSSSSWLDSFLRSLRLKYRLFDYRLVYVASALGMLALAVNVVVYACRCTTTTSLLMPRSFRHALVNLWLAVLALLVVYTLGSAQIHMPRVCLLAAALTHYLLLVSFVWYVLFFYALYRKLAVLKRRNAFLIFVPDAQRHDHEADCGHQDDDDDMNSLDGKKPGTHTCIIVFYVAP